MLRDPFLDRPRERVTTSAGEGELPVLYRDTTAVFALFRIERGRAADALAETPFAPARLGRESALAVVAAFDHRDSTAARTGSSARASPPSRARSPRRPSRSSTCFAPGPTRTSRGTCSTFR